MANIHIKRNHCLGIENARVEVEKLAQSLSSELQADYAWTGNKLEFTRLGASGTINVGADFIDLEIDLRMPLSLMKAAIEQSINNRLDAALS
jgi:putative polyhydroxyalkanoate system protein